MGVSLKIFLFVLVALAARAQNLDRVQQAIGSVHFEREGISCGIQNNYYNTDARIHKIRFELLCEGNRGRSRGVPPQARYRYQELVTYRCEEDYSFCDIVAGDFEIYEGPSYQICPRILSARCVFTYSLHHGRQQETETGSLGAYPKN